MIRQGLDNSGSHLIPPCGIGVEVTLAQNLSTHCFAAGTVMGMQVSIIKLTNAERVCFDTRLHCIDQCCCSDGLNT